MVLIAIVFGNACTYSRYLLLKLVGKQKHAFSQFTHLPILFVDDWSEVTIDFLRSKIQDYIDFDFNQYIRN